MTEAEWLAATEPDKMLWYVCKTPPERKLRLLGVAMVQRLRHLLPDTAYTFALVAVEQFADGAITTKRLKRAAAPVLRLLQLPSNRTLPTVAVGKLTNPTKFLECFFHASRAEEVDAKARRNLSWPDARSHREQVWKSLLQDIFGNPFCPVDLDPTWLTETVVALATGIYAEHAFDRMPILADALEEAGCDNHEILNHLRSDGPHVKGCWALDLVLGKC